MRKISMALLIGIMMSACGQADRNETVVPLSQNPPPYTCPTNGCNSGSGVVVSGTFVGPAYDSGSISQTFDSKYPPDVRLRPFHVLSIPLKKDQEIRMEGSVQLGRWSGFTCDNKRTYDLMISDGTETYALGPSTTRIVLRNNTYRLFLGFRAADLSGQSTGDKKRNCVKLNSVRLIVSQPNPFSV